MLKLSTILCFCLLVLNLNGQTKTYKVIRNHHLKSIIERTELKLYDDVNIETINFDTNGFQYPYLNSLNDTLYSANVSRILGYCNPQILSLEIRQTDSLNQYFIDTTINYSNKIYKAIAYRRSWMKMISLFNDSGNIVIEFTDFDPDNKQCSKKGISYFDNTGKKVFESYSVHYYKTSKCFLNKNKKNDFVITESFQFNENGLLLKHSRCHNKKLFYVKTYSYLYYQ